MLSGGKDSTALALYMKDKYPEIEMEYLFTDTHKELKETYEYLTKIEAYIGKPVIRISSEKGERGFDHFLKMFNNFLPSPNARWCTKELKIKHVYCIANKVRGTEDERALETFCAEREMNLLCMIPNDDTLITADRANQAPLDYDANGIAVMAISELSNKLMNLEVI